MKLKSVGEEIQFVKWTQRGEILLEFRRSAEVATEMHRFKLRRLLAEGIEVRTIIEKATFELRHLDKVITEEEIITVRKDQIGKYNRRLSRRSETLQEILGRRQSQSLSSWHAGPRNLVSCV